MKKGFTLVEMLVVITVLSIVAILVLTIFTRSLRASHKAQVVLAIKQNGQSVLETIDKTIRSSNDVICVSNQDASTIVVHKDEDNIFTRYSFKIDDSGKTNGGILQDNPAQEEGETDQEFEDRLCDFDDIRSAVILTDTNTQRGVRVIEGSFEEVNKDEISIQFSLGPGVGVPETIAGQIDSVKFQTTVQLR